MENRYVELETIKETKSKRIIKIVDLDRNVVLVKKVYVVYDKNVWDFLKNNTVPNIPHIYSVDVVDHHLEVIEEFIQMPTLDEITCKRTMNSKEALNVILHLCDSLEVLHNHIPPIIHKDIKPENIYYDGKKVILGDFDIARVYRYNKNQDTELLGSTGYASPEHYGFSQTDQRSDIYSLGVLYNVLLCGQMPNITLWHGYEKTVIKQMIAVNPDDRFDNIKQLRQRLLPSFTRKTFLRNIPGFRTGKWYKMIIASCSYFIIFVSAMGSTPVGRTYTQIEEVVNDVVVLIAYLIMVAFCTNFMNCYKICIFKEQVSLPLRVIGRIITCIIVLLFFILFATALMTALSIT